MDYATFLRAVADQVDLETPEDGNICLCVLDDPGVRRLDPTTLRAAEHRITARLYQLDGVTPALFHRLLDQQTEYRAEQEDVTGERHTYLYEAVREREGGAVSHLSRNQCRCYILRKWADEVADEVAA